MAYKGLPVNQNALSSSKAQDPRPQATSSGGGASYSYSNGGGYSSGDTGPTDQQKEAAKALGSIAAQNAKTAKNKGLAGQNIVKDTVDETNDLWDSNVRVAWQDANSDWFKQQQNLQSTYNSLRDRMGRMAYGSGLAETTDLFKLADDQIDVDVLKALRKNLFSADSDQFNALSAARAAFNETAANTEAETWEGIADYAAQLASMHPDLVNGEEEGFPDLINDDGLNIPDWAKALGVKSNAAQKASGDTSSKGFSSDASTKFMPTMDLIRFTDRQLFRNGSESLTANKKGLTSPSSGNTGSANSNYWAHALGASYSKRHGNTR